MKRNLSLLTKTDTGAIYSIDGSPQGVTSLIASTKYSRTICNDPFCLGVQYTEALKESCSEIMRAISLPHLNEANGVVTNILRGGLNFCLREALAEALDWNSHTSAFLSAQRVRSENSSEDWFITEASYRKVYLPENPVIIMGDVVATGTSLSYALKALVEIAKEQKKELSGLLFFTIGAPRTEEIIAEFVASYKLKHPNFIGATIVYLEGCFAVADKDTPLSIKITGTDLIRRDSLLAPEFLESQKESPTFPIERCTIYDAGSRAFHTVEYLQDVKEYWEQCQTLAQQGLSFEELLQERLPEISTNPFGEVSLTGLCTKQIEKIEIILEKLGHGANYLNDNISVTTTRPELSSPNLAASTSGSCSKTTTQLS